MTRDEIIERVRRLDREQLQELLKLLDQLEGRKENPPPGTEQDPAAAGSE